jgi:cyclin A
MYIEDIYTYLRREELRHRPREVYMDEQQGINQTMRGILVDWLVEVAEEYKLAADTLFLAVNLIDRFLSKEPCERCMLQLVGVTCMLIAAKFEEIYAPQVDDFCYITDNTYTHAQVRLALPRRAAPGHMHLPGRGRLVLRGGIAS